MIHTAMSSVDKMKRIALAGMEKLMSCKYYIKSLSSMFIYIYMMIEKQKRCFKKGEGSRRYMFHSFLKSKCIN